MRKEKKSKKINLNRILILIILVIAIVTIIGIIFKQKDDRAEKESKLQEQLESNKNYTTLENGVLLNTSKKIGESKSVKGLKVTNIQITQSNGITTIVADITNSTEKNVKGFSVNVIPIDKNGEEMTTLTGYIQEIESGKSTSLVVSTSYDFINCENIQIEEK